jgi:hypothetical protein
VAWGLTILNTAPNRDNAIKFLHLLFTPDDVGQASLRGVGPEPISPPVVTADDYGRLPTELQSLIGRGDPLAT